MSLTDDVPDAPAEPRSASRASGQLPTADSARQVGRGVRFTWWYTYVSFVVFFVFLLGAIALVQFVAVREAGQVSAWVNAVLGVGMLICIVTMSVASYLVRDVRDGRRPSAGLLVLLSLPAVLTALATVVVPGAALTGAAALFMICVVMAPLVGRTAYRFLLVLGVAVLPLHWWATTALTGVEVPGEATRTVLIFVVVFAPVYLFSVWWWHIVVELDEARRESGQLAVTRERLRFAADLHDIQGHHLQVIALKAELAERLLRREDTASVEMARENISEVRVAARTALDETRALVRDLREVSLPEELANARDVLEAAGAQATVDARTTPDAAVGRLFGLAVREATTNILRHAQAMRVTFRLDRMPDGGTRLEVRNDGVGGGLGTPEGTDGTPGGGLAGLDRRFDQAGGRVTGHHEGNGFVLEAVLPAATQHGETDREGTG